MKRTIIICFVLACCLFNTKSSLAQMHVGLAFGTLDSAKVELNWNNPINADSIYLTYSTIFGSQTQVMVNPVPNSATFKRADPTGPIETFDIKIVQRVGPPLYDTIGHANIYGGVVIVEEDILFNPINDHCELMTTQDTAFYFVQYCLVANRELTCEISGRYIKTQDEGEVDEVSYTQHLVQELEQILDNDESGVQDCGEYEGLRRRAKVAPAVAFSRISPNPFSTTLNIKFDLPGTALASVSVMNMQGAKVYQTDGLIRQDHRINTADWPAGMYITTVRSGNVVQTHKLIKY